MNKLILAALFAGCFFFLAPHAHAAITVDATSSYKVTGTASSFSWSQTVNSADEVLVVGESDSAYPRISIQTLTYDGANLTRALQGATSGSYGHAELWYLVNPATGTHDITVTYSASQFVGTDFAAASFAGVDQTTPIDASASSTGSGTSLSASITTTAANDMLVDAAGSMSSNGAATAGAGQTVIYQYTQFGSDNGAYSYKAVSTAGSYSMSWSGFANFPWVELVVALKPASGSTPTPPPLLYWFDGLVHIVGNIVLQ
ncbi:MAG: hypothetical protein KGL39_14825 [Patescibacteria group bacterium]|nr:hypothetical protein [Patescibacteria group bacterium]